MAKGGNFTQRVDIIDSYDPRVTGRAAAKGTLFRYIPAIGDPELLIKADDGFTTNWISLAGGSSLPITVAKAGTTADINLASAPANIDGVALNNGDVVLVKNQAAPAENGVYDFNGAGNPMTRNAEWAAAGDFIPGRQVFVDAGTANLDTLWADADYVAVLGVDPVTFVKVSSSIVVGLPNTLAFFNAIGELASTAQAVFDPSLFAMSFNQGIPGALASGEGSLVHGRIDAGTMTAAGNGTMVHGYVVDGSISATGNGATARGFTSVANSQISASGAGSFASGYAINEGVLSAMGEGAHVIGQVDGTNSVIRASVASLAGGYALTGGVIQIGSVPAGREGNIAFGIAEDQGVIGVPGPGGTQGRGSLIMGYAVNAGSLIEARGNGQAVHGRASLGAIIRATAAAHGSFVHGVADNTSTIESSASAGHASGHLTNASQIMAQANGATARGYATDTSQIVASGGGSQAFGHAFTSSLIQASGEASFAFGFSSCNGANGTSLIQAGGNGSLAGGWAGPFAGGSTILAGGPGSVALGYASDRGTINANAEGSVALGFALANGNAGQGNILSLGQGSFALGYVEQATLTSSGRGSFAFGKLTGSTAAMQSTGDGALVHGVADNQGTLIASGAGACVHAYAASLGTIDAQGAGSIIAGVASVSGTITTSDAGAYAHGLVTNEGSILASGQGSEAAGRASNPGAVIQATAIGAKAFGTAPIGGVIQSSGSGAVAQGASVASTITASGGGSIARGTATNGGLIEASTPGSSACGSADNGQILAGTENAAFAYGYVENGGIIQSVGLASFVHGGSLGPDAHIGIGNFSATFGVSNTNSVYACFAIGKFSSIGGDPANWVDTDPLFVAGNGVSGIPANAFQLDKDGKIRTTAAQIHAVRGTNADTTLSPRTDHSLFVDTATAAGNVTVTFPAGDNGLEFYVKDRGNAAVNNILFVASGGGEFVEAGADITNNGGARHFQFFNDTWYVMSKS